ncbi:MAG: hypothetical protein IPH45_11885 [Bacteroidales bacterium]|nr:hypothetical protein [Bacteroidales bacterium]
MLSIEYAVTETSDVRIALFNAIGDEITSIAEGVKTPGIYKLKIETTNLSNGVYYIKRFNGNDIQALKVVHNR